MQTNQSRLECGLKLFHQVRVGIQSLTCDSNTNFLSRQIKNGLNKGFSIGWQGVLEETNTEVSAPTGLGTNL